MEREGTIERRKATYITTIEKTGISELLSNRARIIKERIIKLEISSFQ